MTIECCIRLVTASALDPVHHTTRQATIVIEWTARDFSPSVCAFGMLSASAKRGRENGRLTTEATEQVRGW